MSAGHKLNTVKRIGRRNGEREYDAARQAISIPRFTLNRDTYDLPYLAGYSKDGRIIYIDRHLPQRIDIAGKSVDVTPFLVRHESFEAACIHQLGYSYDHAHELATHAEHRLVRDAGLVPSRYERALRPYIKADEVERLTRCPADLDLTPYEGSPKLLSAIRRCQGSATR